MKSNLGQRRKAARDVENAVVSARSTPLFGSKKIPAGSVSIENVQMEHGYRRPTIAVEPIAGSWIKADWTGSGPSAWVSRGSHPENGKRLCLKGLQDPEYRGMSMSASL